jgi:hypothetical protein
MTECQNVYTLFHSLLSYSYPSSFVIVIYKSAAIMLCYVLLCVNCFFGLSPYCTVNTACRYW